MKQVFSILMCLASTWNSMAQVVTLYDKKDFAGESKSFGYEPCVFGHRLSASGDFNDKTSSIKVQDGYVAIVFEHAGEKHGSNYGYGRSMIITKSTNDLQDFDNAISFVIIKKFDQGRSYISNISSYSDGSNKGVIASLGNGSTLHFDYEPSNPFVVKKINNVSSSSKNAINSPTISDKKHLAYYYIDNNGLLKVSLNPYNNNIPVNISNTKASPLGSITTRTRGKNMDIWWVSERGAVQWSFFKERTKRWETYEVAQAGSTSPYSNISVLTGGYRYNNMDLFWPSINGALKWSFYSDTNKKWETYEILPPNSINSYTGIQSISRDKLYMDIFFVTPDGRVRWGFYKRSAQKWEFYDISQPNSAAKFGSLTATTRQTNHMEVWWVTPDGAIKGAHNISSPSFTEYVLSEPWAVKTTLPSLTSIATKEKNISVYFTDTNGCLSKYERVNSTGRWEFRGDIFCPWEGCVQ